MDNKVISLAHIGVGGQKGYVYDINGICPCLPATQYKDPAKFVWRVEKQNDNKKHLL